MSGAGSRSSKLSKKRKLPSPRVLRRLLAYNPGTGELRWNERPAWMFRRHSGNGRTRSRSAKAWNNKLAGKEALASISNGYKQGRVFDRHLSAHRAIWAIKTGAYPTNHIDHINGNRSDNRWANLRQVTPAENQKNMKLPKDNRSGVIGVSWAKREQAWVARIKNMHIGYFKNFEDAVTARKRAERELSFHPNHGHPNALG